MKVEISIDGSSKVYELQALAAFAEVLATGKHREEIGNAPVPKFPKNDEETGKAVFTGNKPAAEPVVEEKPSQQSKIEELADKVVEATNVKDEPKEYTVEAVISMTEEEMKDVPTATLVKALESFGIDPTTRPGKNTNAKLRGLLLSAIAEAEKEEASEDTGKAEDIKPQEEPEAPEEKSPETYPEEEITIDMLRNTARELIAANKRKAIAEAFEECGCSNFSTLKKQDYAKFYELCIKQ